MGDGKHYPEFSPGNPQPVDDGPCPDCQGDGEANVDELLSLYLQRSALWKGRADQAEAMLKRIARSKGGEGFFSAADSQRQRRVEKAARELIVEWEKYEEPAPSSFEKVKWALMGGDPDVDKYR
jgi:hypothetical protein